MSADDQFPVPKDTAGDAAAAGGLLRPDFDPFGDTPKATPQPPAAGQEPAPVAAPSAGGVLRPDYDPFRVGEDPRSPENVRLKAVLDAATLADWAKDPQGRARRVGAVSQITRIPVDTLAGLGDDGIDAIEQRAKVVANDPVRFRHQYPVLADALLNSGESRNFVVTQAPAVSRFVQKVGALFFGTFNDDYLGTGGTLGTATKLVKSVNPLAPAIELPFQLMNLSNKRSEKLWDALADVDATRAYKKAGPNAPDSTVEAVSNSVKDFKRLALLGKIYFGDGTPQDEIDLARLNEQMVPTDPTGQSAVRQLVNVGAQQVGMQVANVGSRGAGAAAGYLLAGGATLAATRNAAAANAAGRTGAAVGGKVSETAAIYLQTLLSAFGDYRDTLDENGHPVDDKTARIVAAAYAAIATAALSKGQQAIYATYGKALGSAAAAGEGEFGRKIIGNKQLRQALLTEYGKRVLTATSAEGSAMGVQTLGQDAGAWLARNAAAYGLDATSYKAPTKEELYKAGGNTMEQALGGGVMGLAHGSVGATTGYFRTMHDYKADVARAGAVPEVAKVVAENKDLAIALPKTIASMITAETAESGEPVTHVYIDPAAVIREATRGDGTVDSELLNAIGEKLTGKTGQEAGDAVLDAGTTGSRIEVPLEKYLRDVATTNLGSRLADDTAVNPIGYTAREHALYRKQIVERAKELLDEYEKGAAPEDPAADADARRIRRQLEEENGKLPEGRRAESDELDHQADVYRAMHLATLAAWNEDRARRGESPLSYGDLFGGLRVDVGGDEPAPENAGATLHALGALLAEKPGEAPAEGAAAPSAETHAQSALHGSNSGTIAEDGGFDLSRVGERNGESFGHGVYFTEDEGKARRYADGGKVYRADLPEDDELIDHGATLDKQPPKVRAALVELLGLQPAQAEVRPDPKGGFKVRVFNAEGREITQTWAADEAEARRMAEDYRTGGPIDPHMTGGELYEELVVDRGGRREASEALRDAGVPGLRYEDFRGKRDYVVWDDRRMPIKETLNEGPSPAPEPPTVSADSAEARRGWTTILTDGAKKIYKVMLSPSADFSTFAHEAAHVYIDIMSVLAQRADAPEQFRKDYATALEFMGYASHDERESVRKPRAALAEKAERLAERDALRKKVAGGTATDDEALRLRQLELSTAPLSAAGKAFLDAVTEREERFARGFEAYLMEGKAPSAALAGMFQRFKLWLTNIYGSAGALGVTLNDDIRGVFDRMLASEREIETTRDALAQHPIFRTPEEAGMTPEEWKSYLADQDSGLKLASRRMASRIFADRARENGRWWRNERARADGEARKEYAASLPARLTRLILKGEAWDGMPPGLERLLVHDAKGNPKKVRINADDAKAILDSDERRRAEADLAAEEQRVVAAGKRLLDETRARQKDLRRNRDEIIGKEKERARDEIKLLRERAKSADNPVDRYEAAKRVGEAGAELDKTVETLRGDYDKAIREEQEKLNKWHEDRREELAKRRDEIKKTTAADSERISHLLAKDGISAELLAEWVGYGSAKEMLNDLLKTPREDDYAKERADEIMQERHPDVANEWQTLREEAEKALHNDHTGRWLAAEISALSSKKMVPRGTPTPVEAIRLAAKMIVEKREVGKTTTGLDLQAEQRASRAALVHAARGEYERAYAAKLRQTLNFWIYREAMHAADERDAFRYALSKAKTLEYRRRIGGAGNSLLDVVNWMLEAFGIRELPEDETRPAATHPSEAFDRLVDLGIDPAFDPDKLAETLATKDWDTMTVAEMRNAYTAFKQIRSASRQVDKVSVLGRKVAVADLVGEMETEAEGLHDRGLIPAANTPREFGYRTAEILAGANAAMTEPRVLFGELGKKAYDFFWRGYRKCRDNEDSMIRKVMPFFVNEWRKFCEGDAGRRYEEVDASELPFNEKLGMEDRRTRLWAIMLAIAFGTQSNRDRVCGVKVLDKNGKPVLDADGNPVIKGGFGWDQEKVADWLGRTLRPDEWDFVESVWRVMDKELWPRLSKMERDVHGEAPDKVGAVPLVLPDGRTVSGGYFPLHPDPRVRNATTDKAADAAALDAFGAFSGGGKMDRSFTHNRAGRADYVVNLDWNVVPQHIIDVLHYVNFYGFVRDAQRVMSNADFSNMVKRRLGSKSEGALTDWLRAVANARSSSIAKTEQNILDVMAPFRARFIMRALGYSIMTPLGDLSNTFTAMCGGVVKARYILPKLITSLAVKPWLNMRREGLAKSNSLRRRAETLQTRMRIELGEVGKAGAKGKGRRSLEAVRMTAWYLYEFTDSLCATVLWKAAYEQGQDAKLGEDGARAFADDALDRILPSAEGPEQSGFVRSRTVGSPQAAFFGYFSKIYNLEREVWHESAQAWLKGDGMTSTAPKAMRAAVRTLGVFLSANVLGELLSGRGPERDEKWAEWAARKVAAAPFMMVPVYGALGEWGVNAAFHKMFHDKQGPLAKFSVRASPSAAGMQTLYEDIAAAFDDKAEGDQRFWSAIDATSTALKLPGHNIRRPAEYLERVAAGKSKPKGPIDFAGHVVYGERRKQATNPLSAASEYAGENGDESTGEPK